MSSIASLVASIDARLAQLRAEIDQLAHTRAALERGAAAQRAGAAGARPTRSAQRRRPAGRGSAVESANGPKAASPAAAEPTRKATRSRRTPPPAAPLTSAGITQLLADHRAGLSARAIAQCASAGYSATLALLRTMEASGQVGREGSRRNTVWRLITDEERIAARAAELERLGNASSAPRSSRPGARSVGGG